MNKPEVLILITNKGNLDFSAQVIEDKMKIGVPSINIPSRQLSDSMAYLRLRGLEIDTVTITTRPSTENKE